MTPSYLAAAQGPVLPSVFLDFTAMNTLDPRITFTRSTTATYTNSSGVLTSSAINTPRFDYDPVTLVSRGLLMEATSQNILLNSLLNGTNLSTQTVTVSATSYTLSFYGTGTVMLSGTATATVTGTGVYPSRKTYTFTPTSGSLTLTVSGTVQYAQLEAKAYATSFIPTAGTATTRGDDNAVMTGTNFSSWYNAAQGTLVFDSTAVAVNGTYVYTVCGAGNSGNDSLYTYISTVYQTQAWNGGVLQANISSGVNGGNACKLSVAYATNNFAVASNGNATTVDTSYSSATMDKLRFAAAANSTIGGYVYIRKMQYFPQRLTNSEVQAFSK